MTTYQNQVAVEATIAQATWDRLFGAAMDAIADCFVRRETHTTAADMVTGLLTEVDTRNCWTLAEALGHPGPHRLQHLLSRARFDHDRAREGIARLAVGELAGQDVVLVADETGDAKSSTDCVGAGRQCSGALKGVGMCQVAVHLAAVTPSVRVVIDRALYLPKDWAADEERRTVAGVPEEIMFATKLEQTAAMVKNALALGVKARWFAGNEVYSSRELRRNIREFGLGYTVGVSHSHTVTDGAGRRWKAGRFINKVQPGQWMRIQTGHGTKGTREYDWAWLDVARTIPPMMADRRDIPTWKDLHRPGRRTGDLLELLDALVTVLPDRCRRPRTHRRRHDDDRPCRTCPSRPADLPRTRPTPPDVRPHTTRPANGARPALDGLAPTSSSHRASLPPAPTRPPGPAVIRTTAAVTDRSSITGHRPRNVPSTAERHKTGSGRATDDRRHVVAVDDDLVDLSFRVDVLRLPAGCLNPVR
ncbi:hypothetical protein GCM10010254_23740 [Streptomyces chromofuscus]|uniref:IS701 family transposase n=1 Tax=Streptomyces chromofuscus TaxID=42881 RepID=UPI00167B67E2|nr:IS701 family transposase [Streptomyces chromofuscus]GGT02681.1 hypothetical protein GCM10010254_23740 [Streptomyces chromofuscus]